MAEFQPAFERMIRHEGGYLNHQVPGDRGGLRSYDKLKRTDTEQLGTPDA